MFAKILSLSQAYYFTTSQMYGFHLWVTNIERLKYVPFNNLVMICDQPFRCEPKPRRVWCLMVDSSKMQKCSTMPTRDKRTEDDLIVVSLHESGEVDILKTDFGP
jgi:hypothetical protein